MIAPLVDELRLADNNLQRAIFATAPRFRPLAPPVAVRVTSDAGLILGVVA